MSIDRSYAVALDADGVPYLVKEASARQAGLIRASVGSSRRVHATRRRERPAAPVRPSGPRDVTAEARRVLDEQGRAMGPDAVTPPGYPVEWFPEIAARAGVRPAQNNSLPAPPSPIAQQEEYDKTLFPEVGITRRRGPGTITWTE
jgi:hypothetical protein